MADGIFETPQKTLRNKYLENVQKQTTSINLPPSPLMKHLGFGTCVQVYKYDRKSASPWAIKKVNRIFRSKPIFQQRMDYEAELLKNLSHPNIIGFRSYDLDVYGNKQLALECMTTSLDNILENLLDSNMSSLLPKKILKVINDIGSAMEYLHFNALILHGDIKSHNILIKNDFDFCKLCDFGVALPLNDKQEIDFTENSDISYSGTQLWSAPEVIDEKEVISDKADIFSFGLVLYETLSLVPPHSLQLDDYDDIDLNSTNEFDKTIAFGTRPPLPESFQFTNDYNEIIELFYHCTADLPEDRPSSKDIIRILIDIKSKRSKEIAIEC